MRKLLLFAVLLASSPGVWLFAQKEKPDGEPHAELVLRSEKPLGSNRLIEILLGLDESVKQPGAKLGVRVCSEKPLTESLATASLSVYGIHDYMVEVKGYERDRIVLLRSKDCQGRFAAYAATELWIIPPGASLPPSVESFKRCQISVASMVAKTAAANPHDYKSALNRLIRVLRARPQVIGVVKGRVSKSEKTLIRLRAELNEARRILHQTGLPKNQYWVGFWPWTEEWSRDSQEPIYPAVYTIEVLATCDSNRSLVPSNIKHNTKQ